MWRVANCGNLCDAILAEVAMKHVGHRLAHRTTRRSFLAHSLAATTLIAGRPTQASARGDYPSRTIKFVVPLGCRRSR